MSDSALAERRSQAILLSSCTTHTKTKRGGNSGIPTKSNITLDQLLSTDDMDNCSPRLKLIRRKFVLATISSSNLSRATFFLISKIVILHQLSSICFSSTLASSFSSRSSTFLSMERVCSEGEEIEEEKNGIQVTLHSLEGEYAQYNGSSGVIRAWPSNPHTSYIEVSLTSGPSFAVTVQNLNAVAVNCEADVAQSAEHVSVPSVADDTSQDIHRGEHEDYRSQIDAEFSGFTPLYRCDCLYDNDTQQRGVVVAHSSTTRSTYAALFASANVGEELLILEKREIKRRNLQMQAHVRTSVSMVTDSENSEGLATPTRTAPVSFKLQVYDRSGTAGDSLLLPESLRCLLFVLRESDSSSSSSSRSLKVLNKREITIDSGSSVFDNISFDAVGPHLLVALVHDTSAPAIDGCTCRVLVVAEENQKEKEHESSSNHSVDTATSEVGGLTQEDFYAIEEELENGFEEIGTNEISAATKSQDLRGMSPLPEGAGPAQRSTLGFEPPSSSSTKRKLGVLLNVVDEAVQALSRLSERQPTSQVGHEDAVLTQNILPRAIHVALQLRGITDLQNSKLLSEICSDVQSDVQIGSESLLLDLSKRLALAGQMAACKIAVKRHKIMTDSDPNAKTVLRQENSRDPRTSWAVSSACRKVASTLLNEWTAVAETCLTSQELPNVDTNCDVCACCNEESIDLSGTSLDGSDEDDRNVSGPLFACNTCVACFHNGCAEKCAESLEWSQTITGSSSNRYINPEDTAEDEKWSCPLCHASWDLRAAAVSGDTGKLFSIASTALGSPFELTPRLAVRDGRTEDGFVEVLTAETALHAAAARNDYVELSILVPPLLIPQYHPNSDNTSSSSCGSSSSSASSSITETAVESMLPPACIFFCHDEAGQCPVGVAQKSRGRRGGATHTEAELFLTRRFNVPSSPQGACAQGIACSRVAAPPEPRRFTSTSSLRDDFFFSREADVSQGREKHPVRWTNDVNEDQLPKFDYIGCPVEGVDVGVQWLELDSFYAPPKTSTKTSTDSNKGGESKADRPASFRGCSDCRENPNAAAGCAKKGLSSTSASSGGALMECCFLCRCWRESAIGDHRFAGGGPRCVPRGLCPLQNSQLPMPFRVSIFMTPNASKGWGLRAEEVIPEGAYVGCYAGEVVTAEEARRREERYESDGIHGSYMLDVGVHSGAKKSSSASASSSNSSSSSSSSSSSTSCSSSSSKAFTSSSTPGVSSGNRKSRRSARSPRYVVDAQVLRKRGGETVFTGTNTSSSFGLLNCDSALLIFMFSWS